MRLSKEQYKSVADKLRTMQRIYWDTFHMVSGNFPKNSKAVKALLAIDRDITRLYYQMQEEFFKDYPEEELHDYGRS